MKFNTAKLIFICLFMLTSARLHAFNWLQMAESPNSTVSIDAIDTDNSGNVFYAASTYGELSLGSFVVTAPPANEQRSFIVKLNAAGELVWVKSFDKTGGDRINDIEVDSDGNLIVAGTYRNSFEAGNFKGTVQNGVLASSFVGKLSTAGEWLWINAESEYIEAKYLALDLNNQVFVTGFFWGNAILGSDSLSQTGNFGYTYVASYTKNGNYMRARQTYTYAPYTSIATDNNGNVYLTGTYEKYMYYEPALKLETTNNYSFYLIKYTPSLAIDYAMNTDHSGLLLADNNDNLWMAYGSDLAKYTLNGQLVKEYTNPASAYSVNAMGISLAKNGDIYTSGYFDALELVIGNDTLRQKMLNKHHGFLARFSVTDQAWNWAVTDASLGETLYKGVSVSANGKPVVAVDLFGTHYSFGSSWNTVSFTSRGIITEIEPGARTFNNVLLNRLYAFTDEKGHTGSVTFTENDEYTSIAIVPYLDSLPQNVPAGIKAAKRFYNIATTGAVSFRATLVLPYSDNDIQGLDENKLQVYLYNGTQWWPFKGVVNTDKNTITVTGLQGFGTFAIFEDTATNSIKTKPAVNFNCYYAGNGSIVIQQSNVSAGKINFQLFDVAGKAVLQPLNLSSQKYNAVQAENLKNGCYLYIIRQENGLITKGKFVVID